MKTNNPLAALKHHVTGAIERGEKQSIAGISAPPKKPSFKLPKIGELRALFVALKKDIGDDYRSDEFDESSTPSMSVTIGANELGEWSYQTGDNSYSGGAYSYPHWAVVTLTRRSNSTELAREAVDQIAELQSY